MPLCDCTDQCREVFGCPLLAPFPRTDVHPDDRGARRHAGKSLFDLAALAGIGKYPGGGRRTLDAKGLEQTVDLLYFMCLRLAIIRERNVEAEVSLAGF